MRMCSIVRCRTFKSNVARSIVRESTIMSQSDRDRSTQRSCRVVEALIAAHKTVVRFGDI